MKNLFKKYLLSNYNVADKLFVYFRNLPDSIKRIIIDLYFLLPNSMSSFPTRLTFFLTDKCNMKCAHCFIIKEEAKKTPEISINEYKKIFKSLKGRTSQILLTGGEPTLRKDLTELCISAHDHGKISTVSIFSNSLYPKKTQDMISEILSKTNLKINYHTSLDGLEEFHDQNRRVKKSFANVIETIKKINELRKVYQKQLPRVVVTMAISKQNVNDIEYFIDHLLAFNVFLSFSFVRKINDVFNVDKNLVNFDFTPENTKKDGTEKFGENYLSDSDLEKALHIIDRKLWSKNPDQMIYNYQKTTLKAKEVLEKYSRSPINSECAMGYEDMVILPNGKIARCEMLSSHADLKNFNYDLEKLIQSDIHSNFLKKTSGCYCSHECGIGVSIMNDKKLLNDLVKR